MLRGRCSGSWWSRCHWCRASCRSVSPRRRNTKSRVLSFWILKSTYALVVRLYSVIVNFICSQIVCCTLFASRKRVILGGLYTRKVCVLKGCNESGEVKKKLPWQYCLRHGPRKLDASSILVKSFVARSVHLGSIKILQD